MRIACRYGWTVPRAGFDAGPIGEASEAGHGDLGPRTSEPAPSVLTSSEIQGGRPRAWTPLKSVSRPLVLSLEGGPGDQRTPRSTAGSSTDHRLEH